MHIDAPTRPQVSQVGPCSEGLRTVSGSPKEKWVAIRKHLRGAPRRQGPGSWRCDSATNEFGAEKGSTTEKQTKT